MRSIGIISGFFVLGASSHLGHAEYIKAASFDCDFLIAIVNNDPQTQRKYGFVPISAQERVDILKELDPVPDHKDFDAIVSIDEDESVAKTLEMIFNKYQERRYEGFTFFNSGDRDKENSNSKEVETCRRLGIEVKYLDMPKRGSSTSLLEKIGQHYREKYIRSYTERSLKPGDFGYH